MNLCNLFRLFTLSGRAKWDTEGGSTEQERERERLKPIINPIGKDIINNNKYYILVTYYTLTLRAHLSIW